MSYDDESIAKKSEARDWPGIVQKWECLKEIKRIQNGPRERIPQSDLLAILSQDYELEPEKVTPWHVQDAMADLIPYYGAVEFVPQPLPERLRFEPQREAIVAEPTELQSILWRRA